MAVDTPVDKATDQSINEEAPSRPAPIVSDFLPDFPAMTFDQALNKARPVKPGEKRPYFEIERDLAHRIAPRLVKEKRGRGNVVTYYASWHTYKRILRKYAPGSQVRIEHMGSEYDPTSGRVRYSMAVAVGIPTSDQGVVWASMPGTETSDGPSYNTLSGELAPSGMAWEQRQDDAAPRLIRKGEGFDPITREFSQAYRRACSLHSLGLGFYIEPEAYKKDQQGWQREQAQGQRGQSQGRSQPPAQDQG